jgi:hypothetical protein
MPWAARIDWQTTAGRTLRRLIDALPSDREWSLTLFGSSPLQLALEPSFTSQDVDLFTSDFGESKDEVAAAIARAGISKEQTEQQYVQLCEEGNFRTSPRWKDRAFTTHIGNVRLTLPHPIDILIAKLHRLADKDLAAFRLVIERTGHPTEDEMRRELQAAVDLYRPNFDEEMIGDITNNTAVLWQELWGKEINVRQEIIAPALAARREGYAPDIPRRDYKAELRRLAEE